MSYSVWAQGEGDRWIRHPAATWADAVIEYQRATGYSGGMEVLVTEDIPVLLVDGRAAAPAGTLVRPGVPHLPGIEIDREVAELIDWGDFWTNPTTGELYGHMPNPHLEDDRMPVPRFSQDEEAMRAAVVAYCGLYKLNWGMEYLSRSEEYSVWIYDSDDPAVRGSLGEALLLALRAQAGRKRG